MRREGWSPGGPASTPDGSRPSSPPSSVDPGSPPAGCWGGHPFSPRSWTSRLIRLFTTLEPGRLGRLPEFVAHYRALGVARFHLSLQLEPDLPGDEASGHRTRFQAVLANLGIPDGRVLVAPFSGIAVRRHHDRLQEELAAPEDWVVWSDSDELQGPPGSLAALAEAAEAAKADVVRGLLVDRVAADGSLPVLDPDRSLWDLFPRAVLIPDAISRAERRKVAMARGRVRVSGGNHFPRPGQGLSEWPGWVPIHHFKWDATVLDRLRFRLNPAFREACPWWVESRDLLAYFEARGGRFDPQDLVDFPLPDRGLLQQPGSSGGGP